MLMALAAEDAIDGAGPVGPQVYRRVHRRVLSNDLPPGRRLSEAEVAQSLGVSRQPVREAFIKLAEEGLVEVRPQRGTYVRKISIRAVMDARFVREAIEADVVRLLAGKPDPALERELMRQIEQQKETLHADARAFVPLDDRFHRTLAEAAGKPFAWNVVEGLKSQMDRVRQLSTQRLQKERLIGQHRDIAAAIGRGDPAAAEAALRTHLREILEDLPVIRQSLPEYFDETGAERPE
jgi:GntR family transcriptional regulator, rspAB operon transcriptional repressor